jgi:hypothetical protein
MKKILCSYGTEQFKKSLQLLEQSAYNIGGIDKVYLYDREWLINTEFYKKNKYILDQKRGGGYWLYKSKVILNTFEQYAEKGDVVMWSDAGLSIISNLSPLFKIMENHPNDGKMLFKLPNVGTTHKAKMWTKRDCFVLCNADEKKFWDADMSNGAVSLWEYNDKNVEFLKEWQKYLRDNRIVTDDPNVCGRPNFPEFKDHRHDQSVLSILAVKYGFELFCDPTQFGNEVRNQFVNSPYEQLFNHHRGNI